MISENTIATLISFLNLREGDPIQRKEYFDSFKEETVFIHFLKSNSRLVNVSDLRRYTLRLNIYS